MRMMTFKIVFFFSALLQLQLVYSQENAGDIDIDIEVNPLQAVNRGLELGIEFLGGEGSHMSHGVGLGGAWQNPYRFTFSDDRSTINGERYLGKLYYQFRYYFFYPNAGLFAGIKIVPSFFYSEVCQGSVKSSGFRFFAPLYFQGGYRFTLRELENFSFSIFLGVGFYLGNPEIGTTPPGKITASTDPNAQENIQSWQHALSGMNDYYSKIATDYGFTVAYVF